MLTRHGWGAVLLSVVTAILGRMFGVLELYVLAAGILGLALFSLVWARARKIELAVQRRVTPDMLQVGEIGRVELRLTNVAAATTAPLQLWEPVSGMGGATLRLAPLHRHESAAANYRLPANRRGTVVFGPLSVERRDPFGLAVQRRLVGGTHEVVILPAHLQLTIPLGAGGSGPMGQHLRMRALGRLGTEFHALRDYIEGDDLRQIHWRASARSETLKVRQVEPDGLRRCTVALDDDITEYSPEGFERAVSAAAGIAAAAIRAKLQLRLLIGANIDLRHTSSLAAMTALANCSTVPKQPMTLTAPAGDGLGLTVLVTGSSASSAVGEARRYLAPNDVLVIVACTAAGSSPAGFVIDATSETEFSSSWAAMTGTHVRKAAS